MSNQATTGYVENPPVTQDFYAAKNCVAQRIQEVCPQLMEPAAHALSAHWLFTVFHCHERVLTELMRLDEHERQTLRSFNSPHGLTLLLAYAARHNIPLPDRDLVIK